MKKIKILTLRFIWIIVKIGLENDLIINPANSLRYALENSLEPDVHQKADQILKELKQIEDFRGFTSYFVEYFSEERKVTKSI